MYICHKAYYGIWIGNEGPSLMLSCVQYKSFPKSLSHLTPLVSVCCVSFHSLCVTNTLQQPQWWLNKLHFIVSIKTVLSEFIALKVTALKASVFLNWAKIPGYLTLRLRMSYIYGASSKARNANVVYVWTYVWQRWNSLFLFAAQCFNTESMQRGFLCHICV